MHHAQQRIAIAGTNGKSTTTALTGLLMTGAGLDPTVVVGSRVTEFQGNVRLGQGSVFIVEADEYRDHFHNYPANIAVVTNIEPDHLDYFGTLERMEQSFTTFLDVVGADGTIVANADDATVMKLVAGRQNVVTFGQDERADLRIMDIHHEAGAQRWTAIWRGETLGEFTLHIPGDFNIMNATAAMATALAAGAASETLKDTLAAFRGIWRRFQVLNPGASFTIVSDYAHHPTAVQATILGAKQFYPNRRIVAVFQPHHRSRLTTLFEDFAKSFTDADETVIVETYTVPGRDIPEAESKTAQELTAAIGHQANYASSVEQAEQQLRTIIQPGDVVLVMGAGNIWRMTERLAQSYGAS